MDLQDLVGNAEIIISAKVESIECVWKEGPGGRNIITCVNLKIQDLIKGKLTGDEFTLEIPGGRIGDTVLIVPGSASFSENGEGVLFLQENPLRLVGGSQGKITDYNGFVFIEDQKIKTGQFIDILKSSAGDSPAPEQSLQEIIKGSNGFEISQGVPFIEISKDSIPVLSFDDSEDVKTNTGVSETKVKPSAKAMIVDNSENKGISADTYSVNGEIFDFIGETDEDNDGYFESFSFNIGIDGDAIPGPVKVYMRIICKTTDQIWWSPGSFIISGTENDYQLFAFDETDFTAYKQLNSELDFTVELWDSTKTSILASDYFVDGEPVKTDRIFSDSIFGSILGFVPGSDADADGYYESFYYIFRVILDPVPLPQSVRIKIICSTTGQTWWSPLYTIYSDLWDETCKEFMFNHEDFDGYISGNTDLDFTVEMWNSSETLILARDESIINEPVKADFIGENDYAVEGVIEDFIGRTDYDHDGYYENFEFRAGIKGTASPGPSEVYMAIICNSTGQYWISTNTVSVSDTYDDYEYFHFDQSDFEGLITENTNLDFSVALVNEAQTIMLARDASVDGEPLKADYVIPPSIINITPDKASSGTDTEVIINGSNFGDPPGTTGIGKVEFFFFFSESKIAAPVLSWFESQRRCILSVECGFSGGFVLVTVTTNSGQVSNEYIFRITFGYGGIHWPVNEVAFRVNENDQSITGEREAILNAANSWNNSGADFSFRYSGSHTNTSGIADSHNDIMWGDIEESWVPARTLIWGVVSSGEIFECDMIFNDEYSWSTLSSLASDSWDVESMALHEFGQFLSLSNLYGDIHDGTYDVGKVMYGYGSAGDTKRNLHVDDISGIKYIYGTGSAQMYTINGFVLDVSDNDIGGVTMSGLPENTVTDLDGFYSAAVYSGWTGFVAPVMAGYSFDPEIREYSNVQSNISNQNYVASITTSIYPFDSDLLNSVQVYPNPTDGIIHLTTCLNITGEIVISLFDETGRIIHLERLSGFVPGESKIIDLSEHRFGNYFLHFKIRNATEIFKIIKK